MFQRKYFVMLSFAVSSVISAIAQPVGLIKNDNSGLPFYKYPANVSAPTIVDKKAKASVYSDPYYMLGNYQFTLLAHASGEYQILSTERVAARLNQAQMPDQGDCGAGIAFSEPSSVVSLTGKGSLAETGKSVSRSFGVGFAQYVYNVDNQIEYTRTLAVKPSAKPNEGVSAFVITAKLKNISAKAVKFVYYEYVRANYAQLPNAYVVHKVDYEGETSIDNSLNSIKTDFKVSALEPFLWKNKESASLYEGFPPSLFMKILTASDRKAESLLEMVKDGDMKNRMKASFTIELKPKQEKEIKLVVGYTFDNSFAQIDAIAKSLNVADNVKFSDEWKSVLPAISERVDTALRQKMLLNAYTLEVLASANQYFGATAIVPVNLKSQIVSVEDQLKTILPLCYYNQPLAKSALTSIMRKMDANGNLPEYEVAFGKLISSQSVNNNSLLFLSAVGEYIRTTGDVRFLDEEISYYPRENSYKTSVLQHVEQAFLSVRDGVNRGSHGLLKAGNEESITRTALTINALDNIVSALIPVLDQNKNRSLSQLIDAMRLYRYNLLQAVLKDWGTKKWLNQAYSADNKAVGADKMDIETQALVLQISDVPEARKQALWSEVEKQLKSNSSISTDLVLGVATFDKEKALALLLKADQPKSVCAVYSANALHAFFKLYGK